MDFTTFYETAVNDPVLIFIAGLVVGFVLRGLIGQGLFSGPRDKKPSRYQGNASESPVKRPTILADLQEPSFDLPDAVMKTLAQKQLSGVSVEQGKDW